ncbi:PGG domain [Dillenia turbinata]|uniref:PGG domain n=1 Tax=Dillenia turbinata TaxID=194707 RepID=A0AAN8Z3Q6_9MAGN
MEYYAKRRVEAKERLRVKKQREKLIKKGPFLPLSDTKDMNLFNGEDMNGEWVKSMDPDLYKATMEGDILEFLRAIQKGPGDRNFGLETCVQETPQGNNVLHIATSFGHYEIVKLVCKDLPFLVRSKNSRGNTALHIAARAGNSSMVVLLANAVDGILSDMNDEGNTALHEALRYRRREVARILIHKDQNLSYSVNAEGKSLLYLAAKAGYVDIVKLIMDNPIGNLGGCEELKNMMPVHAAIFAKNLDVTKVLWEKDQTSFYIRSEEGKNALHCAASIGYLEGAAYLLDRFSVGAYQRDKSGLAPIHVASCKGNVNIIQEFLRSFPDLREMLTRENQNILHVAAKHGQVKVVEYILKNPKLKKLLNERDIYGNSPLHLSTIYQHPRIVNILTSAWGVNLEIVNNKGFTALDIAERYNESAEMVASYRKVCSSTSKKQACKYINLSGVPPSQKRVNSRAKRQSSAIGDTCRMKHYRDIINVFLWVSTLVGAATFTAGFTLPGGDNNSNPDQGIATMLEKKTFHMFVICDLIAMYSSIIVTVILFWAQLGDPNWALVILKIAMPLLSLAVIMMSFAFMAGLYVVVRKLPWLGNFVLITGMAFLLILVLLIVPLCCLASSNYHILKYISYYPCCLMLYICSRYDNEDLEE